MDDKRDEVLVERLEGRRAALRALFIQRESVLQRLNSGAERP